MFKEDILLASAKGAYERGKQAGRDEEKNCIGTLLAKLAALPSDHPNHAAVHREAINTVHLQAEKIAALEAERKQLREALETISKEDCEPRECGCCGIAKKALGAGK